MQIVIDSLTKQFLYIFVYTDHLLVCMSLLYPIPIQGKHNKDLMSCFEKLSESDVDPLKEDCDGVLDNNTTSAPRYQEKCAKNSTLLDHFTVKSKNNHKLHITDCNSNSQISNPHSSSDDPVLSQEEIDNLFTDGNLDSWFDDIT